MKQAFILFQSSAEMGFAPAQHNVGFLYSNGIGVEKDLVEAAKWYRKAVLQGMSSAQYNLALLYMEGTGVEKDVKEAMRLFLLCADAGMPQAYYTCARLYSSGEQGIEKDSVLALNYLQKAVDRGDLNAEYLMGIWNKEGINLDKDNKEALRWFQRAAKKGHGPSLYMVGVFLDGGLAEVENKIEAVKYYHLASDKGVAEAQYALGECYDEGVSVQQNAAEAFRLYLLAADQGLAVAQYSVGVCYEAGVGVAQNSAIATLYFTKAREQGYKGPVSNKLSKSPTFSSDSLPDSSEVQHKERDNDPVLMDKMLQLTTQYPPLLALLAESSHWTCGQCSSKNSQTNICHVCGTSNPSPITSSAMQQLFQSLSSHQQTIPTPSPISSSSPSVVEVSENSGTVICPVCTFQNEGGTDHCYVCGSSF